MRVTYKCLLCGRNKFTKPIPHNCNGNFLKHYNRAARIRGLESIFIKYYNEE